MSDDARDRPVESEKAVTESLGEVPDDQIARATAHARPHPSAEAARDAMEDPANHGDIPFDNRASNPGSTGDHGLAGDLGASSGRRTADHPETEHVQDVSPGTYDAPDVATDDSGPEAEDYDNKSWGGTMRVSGEPRPAPIEDEKSRRDSIDPTPMP
jgi:hypothetical protein